MSSRIAEGTKLFSLKWRLTWLAFLSSGFISIIVATSVFLVSHHYLVSKVENTLRRIADDLHEEYGDYGGATPAFFHCMDDDAEERDSHKTFFLLTGPGGDILHQTPIPRNATKRLTRLLFQQRFTKQFFREREAANGHERKAVRFFSRRMKDGCLLTIAQDCSDLRVFLIFLAATLGGAATLITVLTSLVSLFWGGYVERKLRKVKVAAFDIRRGNWSKRVPLDSRAREIRSLIDAFNAMCDHNEKTLSELRVLTDNIAHDLRTPLTRLSMAAEAAAIGEDPQADLPELVSTETGAMLEMINTMLMISQSEARIDYSPRTVLDLTALIGDLAVFYQPLAETAGLSMNLRLPEGELRFSGHRGKFQRLVGNLIENAIKYTPAGGHIDLTLEDRESSVFLSVRDTGVGIGEADIPHVFTRFWRADTSRNQVGNGLGLALAKAIVTSYGGSIACRSELGCGSEFTVTLPKRSSQCGKTRCHTR